MNASERLWEVLKKGRVIALLAPKTPGQCVSAFEALHPLNVVLEIALRTDAALDGMNLLRKEHPEAIFLAGTVLTPEQTEAVMDAGAAGIVSPDYFPAVVETCVGRDVMCVPGGLNDVGKQLAQKAALYGCDIDDLRRGRPYQWVYKCFPAMAGAPANLEAAAAWKRVYRGLSVIYTGGVSTSNIAQIVRHDPDAIVCGSEMLRDADDVETMRDEAQRWIDELHPPAAVQPDTSKRRDEHEQEGDAPLVVTFGEIMMRLSPGPGLRFRQARSFDVTYGGAEANVAAALAGWGVRSRFVSALPEHDLARAGIDLLRARGVETDFIVPGGDRIGIYFLEHGASQRPSRVIYDRAGSSIASLRSGEIDWEVIFDGADWFHLTGITPALGDSAAAVTMEAIRAAKRYGLKVSLDLNYRAKLWSRAEAARVITPLMEHVDVLIGNEDDPADVFDIRAKDTDTTAGKLDAAAYEDVTRALVERFGLRLAAITLRQSISASDNAFSACLFDGRTFHRGRQYEIHLVDRVGGGDAFAAGLIYSLLGGRDPADALDFALAASCLKQTIHGDFLLASVAEVEALAAGDAAGRIRR